MNPDTTTVPDIMDQPSALPVEPAAIPASAPVTPEVLPAPITPMATAEPVTPEVPPTIPPLPEATDGTTPVPPKSNTKFVIIGLGMLVVALILLSGFLAVQYLNASNANKASSSSSTTTTSKSSSSSSSSKSSSSSSSSSKSSSSSSSTSTTSESPLDSVVIPTGYKLYKNTGLGYAFALPSTYTTSFSAGTLNVKPIDVDCTAMTVEIAPTEAYDPTDNGTNEQGSIVDEDDNIGAIPGVSNSYAVIAGNDGFTLTQVALDNTNSMFIRHEMRCPPASDPTQEITPAIVRKMMDSFQFADAE